MSQNLFYIPEHLTPLYFTPMYAELNEEERLGYNRMHGMYFLEQTIFFEQIMGKPGLQSIIKYAPNALIRNEAQIFLEEEDTHSAWFRELLREVDPKRYETSDFYLLSVSKFLQSLLQLSSRSVVWMPYLMWLQLIAEERAVYYGRLFIAKGASLDPRFLNVQRKHLADEPGHIRRDEIFLQWLWPDTAPYLRVVNSKILQWLLKEFFYLPKRSGWRVVETWLAQNPQLAHKKTAFKTAMDELATNQIYLNTLYPKIHFPRTTYLANQFHELSFLQSFLTTEAI